MAHVHLTDDMYSTTCMHVHTQCTGMYSNVHVWQYIHMYTCTHVHAHACLFSEIAEGVQLFKRKIKEEDHALRGHKVRLLVSKKIAITGRDAGSDVRTTFCRWVRKSASTSTTKLEVKFIKGLGEEGKTIKRGGRQEEPHKGEGEVFLTPTWS